MAYAAPMARFLLACSMLCGAWFSPRLAHAQIAPDRMLPSAVGSPMAQPPNYRQKAVDSLVVPGRVEKPPMRFTIAPKSDTYELNLYVEHSINPILGPGGNVSAERYEPLCTLPCEVALRHRAYVFSVTHGTRGAVKVKPVLQLMEGDDVQIRYQSRRTMRVVGWILLLAGTSAGSILMGSGLRAERPTEPLRVTSGAVMMAASLGFGLWFANVPDRAFGSVTRP